MNELDYKGFKCEYEVSLENNKLLYIYYDNKYNILKDVMYAPLEHITSLKDDFEHYINGYLKNTDKVKQEDRADAIEDIMAYATLMSIMEGIHSCKISIDINLSIENVNEVVDKLHI